MQAYLDLSTMISVLISVTMILVDLLTFCKPKCPPECCGYLDYGKLFLTTSPTISAVHYRRFPLAFEACPSSVYRALQRSRAFF